jgi:hypothetical protein
MDKKLKKIIDENTDKFSGWISIINDHNTMFSKHKNLTQDQQTDLTLKTADVLAKISDIFFQYGGFKDIFDNSKMYVHIYGPDLIIKSTKTGCDFHLGIDNNGIYLETHMRYSENLRHMDDNFYLDFLSLSDLGTFELQESQKYVSETTDKYQQLYSNHKSKIYRLLRNYFVGTAEDERDILLGDFHIHWSYDTNFYDVVYNGCLAFKTLYKLNYSLWKVHDLHKKGK